MAVSIIGAGVAGATMALALQASRPSLIDGHTLNVFERAQGGLTSRMADPRPHRHDRTRPSGGR
jgi:2-polyprenyl-6-methoxyphenol hydroxylase-like FAD-dependent oxidoreductase